MTTPLKRDPSRTLSIRLNFMREIAGRYRKIASAVRSFVDIEDSFGLNPSNDGGLSYFLQNTRYAFNSDKEKLNIFRDWLKEQIDENVLTVDPEFAENAWHSQYINSAYRMGVARSYSDAKNARMPGVETSREEFIRSSFGAPETTQKLELLTTRTYSELQGVTESMAQQMARIMADALANGWNANKTSRELTKNLKGYSTFQANRVARTEIIRAHAEGQLDALERMGIEGVTLMVEFTTGGNPCKICGSKGGDRYTIAEARGVIPVHPHCQCAWIPYMESFG